MGDYANGNIYALEESTYSDNGQPIRHVRRAPRLSNDGRRIFFHKFQLMALMGQGLDGAVTYASDPQVELRYSDDFGHTWSNPRAQSLGKLGNYANRTIWRQLGQSRTRVFEVAWTDPVNVILMGAEIDATPGAN